MTKHKSSPEPARKDSRFFRKNAEILKMIASGKPAATIYDEIALMYEAIHPGMRCSLLELMGDTLKHGGAPSLPEAYCAAVDGLKNGPNIGSCGTSTYTGQTVLVENIETDPKWAGIKEAALPHGLRCCWSEPITDSSGKVLGAFGMYYNHPALPNEEEFDDLKSAARLAGIVMERDQREKALRQSEEKYRTLFENMAEGVFYMSIDGDITDFNQKALTLFGLSTDQFLGRTSFDPAWKVIHEDGSDYPGETHPSMLALKTGKPVLDKIAGVYNPVKRDYVWLNINAIPQFREGETIPYQVFVTMHDISDRKKARYDLQKRTQLLERITDNMFDMVSLSDLKGNYTFVGQSHERILNYTTAELMGKNVTAFVHPDDLPGVAEELQGLLKRGGLKKVEYRYRHKDGHYLYFETVGELLLDENRAPAEIIFSTRDITEQKKALEAKEKLEKELLQAQKMESIGNLAGGIAHEFNNILSIIIGNNELIMDDLPESGLARESAEAIRFAGLRARDVVKHLLTFSRQDDSARKPVDTTSVVTQSLKLIRATTPTNIDIRHTISPDCHPISADATQINQILINLCNNAVDALPVSGGRIDVALCNADIRRNTGLPGTSLQPGRYVKLSVRDNGSGIGQSIRDRIFEPYFTTKDIGKGSGIGLAVVHGIVENHGGSIVCESNEDHGTTFTILIPAYDGHLMNDSEKEDTPPGNGEKILYVDDEISIARLGMRHLKSIGYDAVSISDPSEALKLVSAEPDRFDLVISDMAMPIMPGDQLAAEILSLKPEMPVIICTGYSDRMSERKASEMGIKAFLMKPLNRSELAQTVRDVLDKRHQR